MRLCRSLPALVLCCAATLAQAASNFTFSNPPGPHAVGLRIVHQYDYARAYQGRIDPVTGLASTGEAARPVQTLIWYPAIKGGKPVNYDTYMQTQATIEHFDRSVAAYEDAMAASFSVDDREEGLARRREEGRQPMWAVRDAKPEPGRFPVVVYAPSFNADAAENADLCEYLASHGYIVISSASLGTFSRNMTKNLEGIGAQAGDIAFLISYAHTLPNVDASRLAVAGFSWGGISNVFAAARDRRIKALVALDGSVRYFPKLVSESQYVTPARVTVPMLYLAQRPLSIEEQLRYGIDTSSSFLNAMRYADLYKVTMYPMEHLAFASEFLRFMPSGSFKEYTRGEVSLAHSWAMRYVRHFLDAKLKGDAQGQAFIDNQPEKNGTPPHMLSVEVVRAKGAPADREAMAEQMAKQGFEHADAIYQKLHKEDAAFVLAAPELNTWGYKLLREHKQPKRAIEVFKLYTVLYPQDGNAYDSLAEAYELDGDKAQAIAAYRRSLELEPNNPSAVKRLAALGAPVPGGAK
jgi:dienelactone hydrolase